MRAFLSIVGTLVLLGSAGCERGEYDAVAVSDISNDETVVFFNTAAHFDSAKNAWHLPIHGWIYEPEDSVVRASAFATVLEEQFELEIAPEFADNFNRRVNLLIADNERGKRIAVRLAGRIHQLPESEENGQFRSTIVLSAGDATQHAKDGFVRFTAIAKDDRQFSGAVQLVSPTGVSVISDIDDTVKVSNVTERRRLLENTFLLDFVAVPGMADLYQRWADGETAFHFVSSSPWQLYEPLEAFRDQNGFPWASMQLKAVRFRDETLLDLFKEGTETKPPVIRAILDRYPERQFVLVGDSGEQDPEVYAAILRERPEQIRMVFIRNVTGEDADSDRFNSVFDGIDTRRWHLFDSPIEIGELPRD